MLSSFNIQSRVYLFLVLPLQHCMGNSLAYVATVLVARVSQMSWTCGIGLLLSCFHFFPSRTKTCLEPSKPPYEGGLVTILYKRFQDVVIDY